MYTDYKNQTLLSHREDVNLLQALGIVYLYALVVHLIFLFAFRYFDAKQMEIINYFSPLFYFLAYYANYKGRIALGASIAISEAVIHGAVSIFYVGWNANFHLYIILVYFLIFFLYRLKIALRILFSVLITIAYGYLYIYSIKHEPINSFPTGFIGVSGIVNLVNTVAVLSTFALSYSYYISRNIKLLEEAETQQRLLNAQKNRFFSIFSHDLKNPIGSLKNFIDLLMDRYDKMEEEKRKGHLKQIQITVKDTYKLVINLLEWSQSQLNNIQLIAVAIPVEKTVREIISLIEHQAVSKDINIEVIVPKSLKVLADSHSFHSILRNLISNAVKFTAIGGKVTINAKQEDNRTSISVIDYGIGIAENKLKNLFSIERNEIGIGTANERGTGLGLIVAKEFVEKNNGTIHVKSKINSGSTFTINLPSA